MQELPSKTSAPGKLVRPEGLARHVSYDVFRDTYSLIGGAVGIIATILGFLPLFEGIAPVVFFSLAALSLLASVYRALLKERDTRRKEWEAFESERDLLEKRTEDLQEALRSARNTEFIKKRLAEFATEAEPLTDIVMRGNPKSNQDRLLEWEIVVTKFLRENLPPLYLSRFRSTSDISVPKAPHLSGSSEQWLLWGEYKRYIIRLHQFIEKLEE